MLALSDMNEEGGGRKRRREGSYEKRWRWRRKDTWRQERVGWKEEWRGGREERALRNETHGRREGKREGEMRKERKKELGTAQGGREREEGWREARRKGDLLAV